MPKYEPIHPGEILGEGPIEGSGAAGECWMEVQANCVRLRRRAVCVKVTATMLVQGA